MIKNSSKHSDRSTVGRLYDCIVKQGFKPGDKLPVRNELETMTGLGPRRLREALSVLEHQGVVETRNKGGTIVRKSPPEKLAEPVHWCLDAQGATDEDFIHARACLEGAAAFEAARRKTARDLLYILDALEQLEARQKQQQPDWEEERIFHLAILQATHNPVMLTFERIITLNLERNQTTFVSETNESMMLANRQHRAIFDAVQAGDSTGAMTRMYEHIVRVCASR